MIDSGCDRLAKRSERPSIWALQVAVVLLILWAALDGFENLGFGLLFALLGATAGAWLAPSHVYPWRPLRLFEFALYFARASFLGGLDVAARALHPALPVAPCLRDIPLRLPPGLPRTLFVGVVSLLPGTLSARLDVAREVLTVHALTPASLDGLDDLERRVARLFSLPDPECGR
ncbi:MAG: Na+/H+ antiporter subunit E [Xanthomonadaceae bacterium]|nr:Na+/H+ antiporter subunit E [Xanthomonadaceae bacterium]